jgi:OPA family glycerol-3-phosphate transporter-like MFS transporter
MYAGAILLCLLGVIGIYFRNNPLRHSRWFLIRRFINWFPLGMTYAFLYMARYNLTVSKNALGTLMSKEDFGVIALCGTVTYGCSFVINGPLVDKIGGKKGILISAFGAAAANAILGLLTYLELTGRLRVRLVTAFSIVYALNMYFQSYGAVSIIKIKAYWFHVRERGVFGAIFGSLISIGIYFAFDWGPALARLAQAAPAPGWGHRLVRWAFASSAHPEVDAVWTVFLFPAVVLLGWFLINLWLIKDTPEEAGFPFFDVADASSGHMDEEYTLWQLLKKVFTSRLMMLFGLVELTSGVCRDGIQQWYFIFSAEVNQPSAAFFRDEWGWLLCVFGIVGGFSAGLASDKLFQSRRGPPVALCCGLVLAAAAVMWATLYASPPVAAAMGILIVMCAIGITSLMSGTAAADFGGRKATATCMGIVDGFVYLGSGLQAICISHIASWNWRYWPLFFIPFALLGGAIALRIWNELPAATKKYIEEVENKRLAPPAPIG